VLKTLSRSCDACGGEIRQDFPRSVQIISPDLAASFYELPDSDEDPLPAWLQGKNGHRPMEICLDCCLKMSGL
jgi:hypothetical protein